MQPMIITYFGKQFFKIGQGDMVFAFNPVSKSSKTNISAHFGADIALITTNHPDYNGVEQLSHGEREPFVVNGPGDYEVKKIFIKGVLSDAIINSKKYINTIYLFSVDGMNIAFLGALSNSELSKESREALSDLDILFVPIGGLPTQTDKGMLDAKASAKLASSLEPKLIIPMDYNDNTLKAFLKEMGEEKAEVVDKLTLKRKDLDGKEGEVVVLQPV
jgi:L-ascorbate metabolism protein UlaG (beta-lactamase superfamily)